MHPRTGAPRNVGADRMINGVADGARAVLAVQAFNLTRKLFRVTSMPLSGTVLP